MKVASFAFAATILFSALFVGATSSASTIGIHDYDPWCDLDDDGDIDIYDIVNMANRYGATGTPVNKTALLYNVNDTLTELLLRTVSLESRVRILESFEVESAYSVNTHATTETLSWIDMQDMRVNVSLQESSYLLILFSTEARVTSGHGNIRIRALIDGYAAYPTDVTLTPSHSQEGMGPHRHSPTIAAYSFSFHNASVPQGNCTIGMQWRLNSLEDGIEGRVYDRELIVMAFPIG
jgi:hypothetical protein